MIKDSGSVSVMCGIGALLGTYSGKEDELIERFDKVSHRGPDQSSNIKLTDQVRLYFYRLKIVGTDTDNSNQPLRLINAHGTDFIYMICNGEIYNYQELAKSHNFTLTSGSDCEVLLHLYRKFGAKSMCNQVIGEFAMVLYDVYNDLVVTARDHIGIRSFVTGQTPNDGYAFSSEMTALTGWCSDIKQHPIGTCQVYRKMGSWELIASHKYYDVTWSTEIINPKDLNRRYVSAELTRLFSTIRQLIEKAVVSELMGDRPIGTFLSGGLDSLIVSYITVKHRPDTSTFAIGLPHSPDLVAAKQAAKVIGCTHHHEVNFTVVEALASCSELVRHTATPDTTTNRASMPMYLLSRYIKRNTDIRVMLSGEGPDEIVPGYIYFHLAPTPKDLADDSGRLINELHLYDLARTDHSVSAHGLEARGPLMQKPIIDFFTSLPPVVRSPQFPVLIGASKKPIEKWLLRKAFEGQINDPIIWRPKEAFSDGVGYSWVDGVKKFADTMISDKDFALANKLYPKMTPVTKEAMLWRQLYDIHYPDTLSVHRQWNIQWFDHGGDPSARVLPHHTK